MLLRLTGVWGKGRPLSLFQTPSCLETPRSVFEEPANADDMDDDMLLDQAGKVGPSKKAARPTPRGRGPSTTASKKTPMKAMKAATKAKKPTAMKAAAAKATKLTAMKVAKSKTPNDAEAAAKDSKATTPMAKKKDVSSANEDTPAKVVPKMSRKNVISRAYHKELAASIKAGLCKEFAKENARTAHRKAADEYDANH